MNYESSIAIVTKQKAPSLSGRTASFEGHWSGSYCPGGRQIGPVKPHCESDWNWFVVLLVHRPIKRRNLRECARDGEKKRERMRENESERILAPGTLMVPVKQGKKKKRGLFSSRSLTVGQGGREWVKRADTQRSWHTKASVIGAEMAAVPQAISSGDNPQRWNHWKSHTALGWKDRIRCDRVVCATNWDNQGCNWHSAVGPGKKLPSTSCYGWWGA